MQENLKNKIQEYLTNTGATVASFERKVGVDRAAIYNILRGSSKNPGIVTVIKIADVLDCSLDELLDRKNFRPSNANKNYAYNNTLFHECCDFITKYFLNNQTNNAKLSDVQKYLEEIYSYSIENNIESVDSRFANWLLKSYSEKK